MKRKTILTIILIVCIHYCFAQRAFTDEQLKWELPKKEKKFKLSKQLFTLSDTSIVSTNAVYVKTSEHEHWENYKITKTTKSYIYMRFFHDGRVFISFPYLSYPNVEEFNDLNYGKYGRYVIQDGKVKIELYMNRQYGMMYMFAKPVSNGIQFYKTTGRGIGQVLKAKRSTEGGFYQKIYTKLYNFPQ